MYCPSCGYAITVEVKYCNRCGANLSLTTGMLPAPAAPQVKLTIPTIVIGLTIIGGLGIIFGGIGELAALNVHPAAITLMFLFSMATLFGCSAMLIRFWSKMMGLSRHSTALPNKEQGNFRPQGDRAMQQQLPPRFDHVPSVTEHTTRTFSPSYREPSERGHQ